MREGKAILGHNRKATVGRITDDTAHPFVVNETFAMVHNGTLRGHKVMKDTEVDSDALAHHLEPLLTGEFDKEKFEEEMGKINGAFAVGIYSQPNNRVYLMRNNERPLAVVETDDAWYWASEGLMLLWVLSRNGYDMGKHKIHSLAAHSLVTIDLDTNEYTETEFEPKKPQPRTITRHLGTGQTSMGGTGNKPEPFRPENILSKNKYKLLRKRWLGTRHSFYVDDFVETNFPKTIATGATEVNLLGEVDGEMFNSYDIYVIAVVDIVEVLGKGATEKDITERLYHGIIEDMSYNKATGEITLHMGKVKAFDKSVVTNLVQGKWNAQTTVMH